MFDEEKQTKTKVTTLLEDGVIVTTFSFPCTEMLIRERPIAKREIQIVKRIIAFNITTQKCQTHGFYHQAILTSTYG